MRVNPSDSDSGPHTIGFRVTDGGANTSTGKFQIIVQGGGGGGGGGGGSVSWVSPNLRFSAQVGEFFTGSLTDKVMNPNNASLVFSRKSGPAWFTVASDGSLGGMPTSSLEDSAVVSVSANGSSVDATVTFNFGNLGQGNRVSYRLNRCDDPSVDVVWVMDHGPATLPVVESIAGQIELFYDRLQEESVLARNTYLISDGRAIRAPRQVTFTSSNSRMNSDGFREREGRNIRVNTNSSALFAVFSFWQSLESWQKETNETFVTPNAPLEFIAVTRSRDELPFFLSKILKEGPSSKTFIQSLVNRGIKMGKPVRFHLIAPPDENLNGDPQSTTFAEASVDRALAVATGGTWSAETSLPDSLAMLGNLVDFAGLYDLNARSLGGKRKTKRRLFRWKTFVRGRRKLSVQSHGRHVNFALGKYIEWEQRLRSDGSNRAVKGVTLQSGPKGTGHDGGSAPSQASLPLKHHRKLIETPLESIL